MKSEVIIIGGGVIGGALALRLAQARARVTVIERGRFGGEASRAAAGMLSPQAESEKPDAFFRLAMQSRAMYRGFVEELRELSGIDAQYRDEGTLICSLAGVADHFDRWVSWQMEAGLALTRLTADELRQREPAITPAANGAIFLPEDHQVDNRLLMDALAVALQGAGVTIIEGEAVRDIIVEQGVGQGRVKGVIGGATTYFADAVVVAAGSWSGQLCERLGLAAPTLPVRGQMLAVRGEALRHVLHSNRVYLVPRLDGRVLIGATVEEAGFVKAVTAQSLHALLDAAIELAPALAEAEVLETWSGLRPATPDHLPVLGSTAVAGLWLATGHFRNGILLAPVTAALLAQSILAGGATVALQEVMQDFGAARFAAAASRHQEESRDVSC